MTENKGSCRTERLGEKEKRAVSELMHTKTCSTSIEKMELLR